MRSNHQLLKGSLIIFLILCMMPPSMAQKKRKKLSREEKKQLKFEAGRQGILDKTFSFRADQVDLPHKLNASNGSIVHILKDRIEILEIQWPDRSSRSSEMYTASGTISNYFAVNDPRSNMVTIRFTAETQDKKLYFTITHALEESTMIITDKPGYALTTYRGRIRSRKK